MPTSYSWTLLSPPPASGGSAGAVGAAPYLPCDITAYTQQDILDLFDRLLPPHYLEPLKSPGPGYEVLQAAAVMGARASGAVQRAMCGAYVLSATGGLKAAGSVELYRAEVNPEGILVTVEAGTVVKSSRGGRKYKTLADVVFTSSALGPFSVAVEALLQGYDYNEPGIVVAADGTSLPGEIDTIVTLVESPDMGYLTIQVRHPTATSGGKDADLDQHGRDRRILREAGEGDEAYRGRIVTLPDNISPDAVERALQQVLYPYGQSYNLIETWEMGYQTCWDAPPDPIAGSVYDPHLFCYDDPRPAVPFRNRWLDEGDYRGAFVVTVPVFGPLADAGMAYDDTAMTATDLANPLGNRAVGAWDVPATLAFGYRQGAWDGYDLQRAASMKTLYDTLQRIKAAGVAAALEVEGV